MGQVQRSRQIRHAMLPFFGMTYSANYAGVYEVLAGPMQNFRGGVHLLILYYTKSPPYSYLLDLNLDLSLDLSLRGGDLLGRVSGGF